MEGESRMTEITGTELIKHLNAGDFEKTYPDPVKVKTEAGESLVCMTEEYYDINYWNYEMEMPQATLSMLTKAADQLEMTLNEYCCVVIENAIKWAEQDPEGFEKERKESKGDNLGIQVIRSYPVHRGETEAQARKKAMEQENHEDHNDNGRRDCSDCKAGN